MRMNKGDYSIIIITSKDKEPIVDLSDIVGFEYTKEHEHNWVIILQNMLQSNKDDIVFKCDECKDQKIYTCDMNAYWDDKKKEDALIALVRSLPRKKEGFTYKVYGELSFQHIEIEGVRPVKEVYLKLWILVDAKVKMNLDGLDEFHKSTNYRLVKDFDDLTRYLFCNNVFNSYGSNPFKIIIMNIEDLFIKQPQLLGSKQTFSLNINSLLRYTDKVDLINEELSKIYDKIEKSMRLRG